MKQLQSKPALSAVLLSCSLLFTLNATAQEAPLDKSLAAIIPAQGEKVPHDLIQSQSNYSGF